MATHDYFRLIPSLTNLELSCENMLSFDIMMEVLTTSRDFLPHLRFLTLRINSTVGTYLTHPPNPTHHEDLVTMLTTRCRSRAPLQSFQFIFRWGPDDNDFTSGDVISSLKQLAAEGINIHFGPEHMNLV